MIGIWLRRHTNGSMRSNPKEISEDKNTHAHVSLVDKPRLLREGDGMGEARRRKRAGIYPDVSSPAEKLRRFWQDRRYDGGPIEDFRAPQGTIAITLDVQGAAPSTFTLDVTALVDLVDRVNDLVCKADYHGVVRHIAHAYLEAKQTGDDANFEVIGPLSLWSALHHPKQGAGMRAAVSEVLRRDGKAHISWCFSPTAGLAMGLSDKFMDLEGLAAVFPPNTTTSLRPQLSKPRQTQH
jgi:hypothetical protein